MWVDNSLSILVDNQRVFKYLQSDQVSTKLNTESPHALQCQWLNRAEMSTSLMIIRIELYRKESIYSLICMWFTCLLLFYSQRVCWFQLSSVLAYVNAWSKERVLRTRFNSTSTNKMNRSFVFNFRCTKVLSLKLPVDFNCPTCFSQILCFFVSLSVESHFRDS